MSDPVADRSLGAAMHTLRGKWGALLAFGLALMILGALSLVFAFASTLAMVTLNGVFFLVAGAAEVGVGMHARGWRQFFLFVLGGALSILAGVFCVLNPLAASTVMTLLIGAGLIAAAIMRGFLAFSLPAGPRRGLVWLGCVVTLWLGLIVVMNWPLSSVYVLGTLLGVDLLFRGAGWVSFAVSLRAHR